MVNVVAERVSDVRKRLTGGMVGAAQESAVRGQMEEAGADNIF